MEVRCGFCGEAWVLDIDATGGRDQRYVEDCPVCCRPNDLHVTVDPETLEIGAEASYEG